MAHDPILPSSNSNMALLSAVSEEEEFSPVSSAALDRGTVIADQYRVIRPLSTAEVKGVYLCSRIGDSATSSQELVVLKLLNPNKSGEEIEVAAARFKREVLLTHGIVHLNVVDVYEYIEDGDLRAYSMEYVDGGDLARLIEESGSLPPSRVDDILRQMCRGVREIHKAGIVHRDLKPKNILLTNTGIIKISDFGVAKAQNQRGLTAHGALVGTVEYCSPEYIMQGTIDKRLDIYSLGMIGYELLTGLVPFADDDVMKMLTKRMSTPVDPPENLIRDCPKNLSNAICKALERDPSKRYSSVDEMLNQLQGQQQEASKALDQLIYAEQGLAENRELLQMMTAIKGDRRERKNTQMDLRVVKDSLPEVPREAALIRPEYSGRSSSANAGIELNLEKFLMYSAALVVSILVGVLLYNSRNQMPETDRLFEKPIDVKALQAPVPRMPQSPGR